MSHCPDVGWEHHDPYECVGHLRESVRFLEQDSTVAMDRLCVLEDADAARGVGDSMQFREMQVQIAALTCIVDKFTQGRIAAVRERQLVSKLAEVEA